MKMLRLKHMKGQNANPLLCSFLDQVGSEESSRPPSSPPAAEEGSSSNADLPTVGHTNITNLINESYEVRGTQI